MNINNLTKSDILKLFISAIVLVLILFSGVFYIIVNRANEKVKSFEYTTNVSFEKDQQLIDIVSGGGFKPEVTVAKAGIKTILRVKNNGQLDCSNTLDLPELNIKNKVIPLGDMIAFELESPEVGEFKGSCSMGMYDFRINFK